MLTLAFIDAATAVAVVVSGVLVTCCFYFFLNINLFVWKLFFTLFISFLYVRRQNVHILCRKDHNSLYKVFIILTMYKLFWSQNQHQQENKTNSNNK